MTKEELKKEAEEWLSITDNHLNDERTHFLSESEYAEQAYLAGAEPREKQIEHLSKEIDDLENMKATLENKIAEQKAQIEKMKCCQNCRKFNNLSYDCTCAEVCNEWELRR